jgi:hypothetical protein
LILTTYCGRLRCTDRSNSIALRFSYGCCAWIQCATRSFSAKLPNVHLVALQEFGAGDEELLRAKKNRTLIEYYFTCTPSLPLFILARYPEIDRITYLDADLFFFDSPMALYDEIGAHSIAIIEHRFRPYLRNAGKYGIYNVGWLSFKRDEHALAWLQWWREQCVEWCYDRVEHGRFAVFRQLAGSVFRCGDFAA